MSSHTLARKVKRKRGFPKWKLKNKNKTATSSSIELHEFIPNLEKVIYFETKGRKQTAKVHQGFSQKYSSTTSTMCGTLNWRLP